MWCAPRRGKTLGKGALRSMRQPHRAGVSAKKMGIIIASATSTFHPLTPTLTATTPNTHNNTPYIPLTHASAASAEGKRALTQPPKPQENSRGRVPLVLDGFRCAKKVTGGLGVCVVGAPFAKGGTYSSHLVCESWGIIIPPFLGLRKGDS
jgi:hypothetical protein